MISSLKRTVATVRETMQLSNDNCLRNPQQGCAKERDSQRKLLSARINDLTVPRSDEEALKGTFALRKVSAKSCAIHKGGVRQDQERRSDLSAQSKDMR